MALSKLTIKMDRLVYIDDTVIKIKFNNTYPVTKVVMVHCTNNAVPSSFSSYYPIMVPYGDSEMCLCGFDYKACSLEVGLPDEETTHYCVTNDKGIVYITLSLYDKAKQCEASSTGRHCTSEIKDDIPMKVPRDIKIRPQDKIITKSKKLGARYPNITNGYATTSSLCKCDMANEIDAILKILDQFCLSKINITTHQYDEFQKVLADILFDVYSFGWKIDLSNSPRKDKAERKIELSTMWDLFPLNVDKKIRTAAESSGLRFVDRFYAFDVDLTIYFEPDSVYYKLKNGMKTFTYGPWQEQTPPLEEKPQTTTNNNTKTPLMPTVIVCNGIDNVKTTKKFSKIAPTFKTVNPDDDIQVHININIDEVE